MEVNDRIAFPDDKFPIFECKRRGLFFNAATRIDPVSAATMFIACQSGREGWSRDAVDTIKLTIDTDIHTGFYQRTKSLIPAMAEETKTVGEDVVHELQATKFDQSQRSQIRTPAEILDTDGPVFVMMLLDVSLEMSQVEIDMNEINAF